MRVLDAQLAHERGAARDHVLVEAGDGGEVGAELADGGVVEGLAVVPVGTRFDTCDPMSM